MVMLWIYLPLLLLALSVILLPTLFFMRSVTSLRTAEVILCASCGVSLAFFAYWTWFFRDGLAPGFVPSEGAAAWRQFARDMWLPVVLVFGVVGVSYVFYRMRLARLRRSTI